MSNATLIALDGLIQAVLNELVAEGKPLPGEVKESLVGLYTALGKEAADADPGLN